MDPTEPVHRETQWTEMSFNAAAHELRADQGLKSSGSYKLHKKVELCSCSPGSENQMTSFCSRRTLKCFIHLIWCVELNC